MELCADLFWTVGDLEQHGRFESDGLLAKLDLPWVLEGGQGGQVWVFRWFGQLHELGAFSCFRVVNQALPAELSLFQDSFKLLVSLYFACLLIFHMELFQSNLGAANPPPHKVDDQSHGLG